jgi:RimJ/RimL family protein N-acetyltransferase
MEMILRKLKISDQSFFAKWWQDEELIKLTSGDLSSISDKVIGKYFNQILNTKTDHHWMIEVDNKTIGHISLCKRKDDWFETQIVIGEKDYWNKGYGSQAINLLIEQANILNIDKIYLEVRPDNLRAIKSYKNAGFVSTKIIKYPNNQKLPETLRMEFSG